MKKVTLEDLTNMMEDYVKTVPGDLLYCCEDTDKKSSFVPWRPIVNSSSEIIINMIQENLEGGKYNDPITVTIFYECLKYMEKEYIDTEIICRSNISSLGNFIIEDVIRSNDRVVLKVKRFEKAAAEEESIIDEIKKSFSNKSIPSDNNGIGLPLYGAYERCYINQYKGLKYLLGDPLDGYYGFVDTIDNILEKECMDLKEFIAIFSEGTCCSCGSHQEDGILSESPLNNRCYIYCPECLKEGREPISAIREALIMDERTLPKELWDRIDHNINILSKEQPRKSIRTVMELYNQRRVDKLQQNLIVLYKDLKQLDVVEGSLKLKKMAEDGVTTTMGALVLIKLNRCV